jgi:hypothetical protein
LYADYGILYESVYGASPETTVNVTGNLTVKVKSRVSGKPIKGAMVIIDGNQVATDDSGLAVFDTLAPGTYKMSISASGYLATTKTITFQQGALLQFGLWSWTAIGIGAVGGTLALIGLVAVWSKPK